MDLLQKQTNASDRISIFLFFLPSSCDCPVGISAELTALLCLFVHFGLFCFVFSKASVLSSISLKAQKIIPSAAWQRAAFSSSSSSFSFRGLQLYQYLPNRGDEWALPLSDDERRCRNIAEMRSRASLSRRSCAFSPPPSPTQQSAGSGSTHTSSRSNPEPQDEPNASLSSRVITGGRTPHILHTSVAFSPNSLSEQTIKSFNLLCRGNNGPWHWRHHPGWPVLRAISASKIHGNIKKHRKTKSK